MTTLRRDQKPPTWHVWGMAGGRGAGKRYAALTWLNDAMQSGLDQRGLVVVPKADEIRFTVEELQKINPDIVYKPSIRRLEWPVLTEQRQKEADDAIKALTLLSPMEPNNLIVEHARAHVLRSLERMGTKNFAFITSSDEPDSLRGVQAHYAVGINLHNWYEPIRFGALSALDNLRIATRLGYSPQIALTHSTDYEKIDGATYTMG